MFALISAAALTLTPIACLVPPAEIETWDVTSGRTDADEYGYAVCATADGGCVVAGEVYGDIDDRSGIYLARFDAKGTELWTQEYDGEWEQVAQSVAQTANGGFVVAGCSSGYMYLLKTDGAGTSEWSRTYGGPEENWGYSVRQTVGGGYVIAGASYWDPMWGKDAYLVRTDASGKRLWQRVYGGRGDDEARGVVQTDDGGFALLGTTWEPDQAEGDFLLVRTDASGDTLWTRTYGDADYEIGTGIIETRDHGFALCGLTCSFGAGRWDGWLVRTDSLGDTLWTQTFGGRGDDGVTSVCEAPDRGLVVCGYYEDEVDYVMLAKTDERGDTLWSRIVSLGEGVGYSVALARDGGFIAAGYVETDTGLDVLVLKRDADGRR